MSETSNYFRVANRLAVACVLAISLYRRKLFPSAIIPDYTSLMDHPLNLLPELPRIGEDPVIEAYRKDVDQTLIETMGRLTPDQRVRWLQDFVRDCVEIRRAGKEAFER